MTSALTTLCMAVALIALVPAVNVRGQPGKDDSTALQLRGVDLTGFYVEGQPFMCGSAASVVRLSSRVLLITHSNGLLRLSFPHQRMLRLIHIERPDSARLSPIRKNGLARWDGDTLTVETTAPAFPLWGDHAAALPGTKLIESFIRTSDHLLYRTAYTLPASTTPLNQFEVSLAKCALRVSSAREPLRSD